ncbi:hypothetical protein ACWF50_12085 [Brucella pseudogrignonensis]
MSSFRIMLAACYCASAAVTAAQAGGEDPQLLQPASGQTLTFDGGDPQATAVARQMYGSIFRFVEARRIWLKAPDDGYEQMAVQLSQDKDCSRNCLYAVLYHDDPRWLEVWRGPAGALRLGPIGPEGLRSIDDGMRLWRWTGGAYWPALHEERFAYRAIRPQEKASIETGLKAMSGAGDDGIRYGVLDLPLKDGMGALVAVASLDFCGQAGCPVFVLDEDARILGRFHAIEGQAGASSTRDAQGNPMIETRSVSGVGVYRIGEDMPAFEIKAQRPILAGGQRQ